MSLFKTWSNCCLRRRSLTSRLLPACLQLVLIIIIWWVLKSQTTSALDKKDNSDEEKSLCQIQGFPNTKTLHFLDLGSILLNSKSPKSSNDHNFTSSLQVDLYIRDGKMGTVLLYPAGTLVYFNDKRPIGDIDTNKDDIKYDYEDINKGSDDYTTNTYDNYDVKLDHNIIGDNENLHRVESGKESLSNTDEGVKQIKGVNNQAFDYGPLSNNRLQESIVSGLQNNVVANQALYQNQMLQVNAEERVPGNSFDKGHYATGQYGMQNSIYPNNKINFMQPQHQNVVALRNDMSNLNPQSNFFQNLQLTNQNPNARVVPASPLELANAQGYEPQFQVFPKNPAQNLGNQPNFPGIQETYNAQHANAFGSMPELSNVRNLPSLQMDGDPVLAEGFLDRASKVIFEIHGKPMNEVDPNSGGSSNALLMNNPQACQSSGNIDILYLINSKPQSSDLRQRIRDTFVQSSYFQPFGIAHVFLVGRTTSSNFQASFNQEQERYSDIVQGDFMDVPENATIKGLMGMRWVVQFCHQAKYVMIINEDVFVDTFKLLRGLIPATDKLGSKRNILCYFIPESPVIRSGANAVSENLFPGRMNMRPYCKGFAVLMNRGVTHSLFAASAHVQPFNMDELYLFGILPFVVGDINVYDVGNKRAFNNFGMETVGCYKQRLDKCPFVASVAFSERFTSLWEFVKTRPQEAHSGWEGERSLWNLPSYIRKF